jgi:hypothetical protein
MNRLNGDDWLRTLVRGELPQRDEPEPQQPHAPKVPQGTRGTPGFPIDGPDAATILDDAFRRMLDEARYSERRGIGGWRHVEV